jgi:hypothetical protein
MTSRLQASVLSDMFVKRSCRGCGTGSSGLDPWDLWRVRLLSRTTTHKCKNIVWLDHRILSVAVNTSRRCKIIGLATEILIHQKHLWKTEVHEVPRIAGFQALCQTERAGAYMRCPVQRASVNGKFDKSTARRYYRDVQASGRPQYSNRQKTQAYVERSQNRPLPQVGRPSAMLAES